MTAKRDFIGFMQTSGVLTFGALYGPAYKGIPLAVTAIITVRDIIESLPPGDPRAGKTEAYLRECGAKV